MEPGREIEVQGVLHDKETGEVVKVDGKEITATAKFAPSEANGAAQVTFKFDASSLAGKTLVAYEKAYDVETKSLIGSHEDINDNDQTVNFPELHTTALNKENADHIVEAVNEKDSAKLYGIYTIKVVSGEIQITKKLESALGIECTFNFSIKDESGKEIQKVSITIPANSTVAKFTGEDLKDLPRGIYTISEEDSNGYVLTDYQVDNTTNCRNTSDEQQESVTFKLGYEMATDSDGKDVDVIKNYTYNENSGGTVGSVTFTNEKATTAWDIVKVSTSGNQVRLPGAEFVLQQDGETVYTGTSNTDGKIIWKKAGKVVSSLEKGEYTLKETKAPTGYVLSNEVWTIKTTKGGSLVSYTTDKSNGEIDKSEISETDGTLHLYFKNEVVYDLPSTGHTGIFNILMSGILLMFAGILIIYKMKGKEVLKK